MKEVLRLALAVIVFALALFPSVFLTACVTYFFGWINTLWPLVPMLGLPLVATLLVDRKVFGK